MPVWYPSNIFYSFFNGLLYRSEKMFSSECSYIMIIHTQREEDAGNQLSPSYRRYNDRERHLKGNIIGSAENVWSTDPWRNEPEMLLYCIVHLHSGQTGWREVRGILLCSLHLRILLLSGVTGSQDLLATSPMLHHFLSFSQRTILKTPYLHPGDLWCNMSIWLLTTPVAWNDNSNH